MICFAAYQAGTVAMRKRLDAMREWLTPRRRLWAGIGLFAVTLVVPAISPGTSVSWLVGPACVFFVSSFMPVSSAKR